MPHGHAGKMRWVDLTACRKPLCAQFCPVGAITAGPDEVHARRKGTAVGGWAGRGAIPHHQ